LKLNGTHQLLVYADDVSIKEGSAHTMQENAEALLVAGRETRLDVNADKTKYMVMCRAQNAGRSHSVKSDFSSFEKVEELKCLGTNLITQNCIWEQTEVRECLLSFGEEYFVFQLAIQKFKGLDIQSYNFA